MLQINWSWILLGSQGAAHPVDPPDPPPPPPPGAPPPPVETQVLPDLAYPALQVKSHRLPLQAAVEFGGGLQGVH